jgi:CHASE1-domain containing sensor protein
MGVGIFTAAAYSLTVQRVHAQTDIKFAEITDSYVRQLSQTIEGSANLLYATRGLFAAANVDSASWERFIQMQHSFERYPGVKAISYAKVKGGQVPVTYLSDAPGAPSHAPALGFDLNSEPARREALQQARVSGAITATAPLRLVPDNKLGFLMALAVSDKNAIASSAPDQVTGYSLTAFNSDTLINTVLAGRLQQYQSSMTITDISDPKPIPLYVKTINSSGRKVQRVVTLQVADRTWRLTFQTPASTLLTVTDRYAPAAVLAGGIVFILALGVLVYTLRLRKKLRCMIIP